MLKGCVALTSKNLESNGGLLELVVLLLEVPSMPGGMLDLSAVENSRQNPSRSSQNRQTSLTAGTFCAKF